MGIRDWEMKTLVTKNIQLLTFQGENSEINYCDTEKSQKLPVIPTRIFQAHTPMDTGYWGGGGEGRCRV